MVAVQYYLLVKFLFSSAVTCFHAFTSYKEKGGIFKMYLSSSIYFVKFGQKRQYNIAGFFSPIYAQAQNTTNIILTTHLQKIKRKVK